MNSGRFNISPQQVQSCKGAETTYSDDQVPSSWMCTVCKAPESTQAGRCVAELQKAIGDVVAH